MSQKNDADLFPNGCRGCGSPSMTLNTPRHAGRGAVWYRCDDCGAQNFAVRTVPKPPEPATPQETRKRLQAYECE